MDAIVDPFIGADALAAQYGEAGYYQTPANKFDANINGLIGLNENTYYVRAGLPKPTRNGEKVSEEEGLHIKSVREAGFATGVRAGLVWKTDVTNKQLDLTARNLDSIYNFSSLVIDSRVIPPVLVEVRDVANTENDRIIRTNSVAYEIKADAKFSSRAPHWRSYLYRTYDKNSILPDPMMLPRNALEQQAWDAGVRDGWPKGVMQGREILKQDLDLLDRDYKGMVLYHRLADQNMLSIPIVTEAKIPLNATGSRMEVDGSVLQLVAIPQFVDNRENWRPLILERTVNQQPSNSAINTVTAENPVVVFDSRKSLTIEENKKIPDRDAMKAREAATKPTKIEASKPAPASVVMVETMPAAKVDEAAAGNISGSDQRNGNEGGSEKEVVVTPLKESQQQSAAPSEPKGPTVGALNPDDSYAVNPGLNKLIKKELDAMMASPNYQRELKKFNVSLEAYPGVSVSASMPVAGSE